MFMPALRVILTAVACATAIGCKDAPPPAKATAADTQLADSAPETTDVGQTDVAAAEAALGDVVSETAPADKFGDPDCDPLQPLTCAMPFPSSKFLVEDASTPTGFRVHFGKNALPKNSALQPIDPSAWHRMDGFSVGSSLVVQLGDVDMAPLPTQKTVDKSIDKASPIVWLEVAKDGTVKRRIPHWAELDLKPTGDGQIDPQLQVLFVRPGVILDYNTRYIVALRGLQTKAGKPVARSPAFAALAAGATAGTQLAARQKRFDGLFAVLAKEGIAKEELTLAWDFHTYSGDAVHGRMLEMRDKALAAIGDKGAAMTFDSFAAKKDGTGGDPHIAHTLRGKFKAPNFMKEVLIGGTPGTPSAYYCKRWNVNDKGELVQNGWRDAELWIRVPHSAMDGTPHDFLQYGHGLNGSGNETYAGWVGPNANSRKFIYIANSMIGMSGEDTSVTVAILQDLSLFPCLAERVAAGVVEHLVFARTMKTNGAAILSEALSGHLKKDVKIQSTGKVFWSGNSQGGIYGQTVTAVSQDITRAHLGQPGLNYHLLLERSVDFEEFSLVLSAFYGNRAEYALLLSLVQMQWDYVDPVTYIRHIEADPLPNTPKHAVLAVVHPGDFQVDAVTMELAARSGYLKILPHYGKPVPLVAEAAYPQLTSAMIAYDFGNSWFIQGNSTPIPEDGLECGDANLPHADGPCLGKTLCDPKGTFKACKLEDPHDRAHGLKSHNDQMRHFFDTGEIKDFCGGNGCKPE